MCGSGRKAPRDVGDQSETAVGARSLCRLAGAVFVLTLESPVNRLTFFLLLSSLCTHQRYCFHTQKGSSRVLDFVQSLSFLFPFLFSR